MKKISKKNKQPQTIGDIIAGVLGVICGIASSITWVYIMWNISHWLGNIANRDNEFILLLFSLSLLFLALPIGALALAYFVSFGVYFYIKKHL